MRSADFGALARIADAIGTPFFVYNAGAVRTAVASLQEALLGWGDARISYSVKTNPVGAILGTLQEASAWAEVVSVPEFDHALAIGFRPDQIVFNGPLKASGFSRASLGAACINVDGLEEIGVLDAAADQSNITVRVGIRVCPPFTAPTWSRFGLNVENGEFDQAIAAIANSRRLQLAGLHAHLGTQVDGEKPYQRLIVFLRNLWKSHGFPDDALLDIGGGYSLSHDKLEQQLPNFEFFRMLADTWGPDRPRLIIEPGRIVAGPSMTLVCRVLSRKRRPREPDILVIDGGTNHNVMGAFFEHAWSFEDLTEEIINWRLCGPLCMEDDLMSGSRTEKVPRVGSLLAMHNAGAYSFTLARNFIQGVPPIVEINEGSFRLIASRGDLRKVYGNHNSGLA